MKRAWVALVVLVLVLIGLNIVALLALARDGTAPTGQTLYDKVQRTQTIRCSYAAYPPYCIKDPETGQLSGIFVEVLEEAGHRLNLKVEWVEEVGWGTIIEGLESGRHDLFGAGLWRNSTRGKRAYFSRPVLYNGIRVWVRSGETRIDSLDDINSPDVRIAVQDGAMDDVIATSDFPKAKKVSIPQLNPWSDTLLNTISQKTDVSFSEPGPINAFLKKNPGTLKELDVGKPLRVFANCYAFKMGEDEFAAILNSAILELQLDGTIERILQRYEAAPGEFLRVSAPYALARPTAD